MPRSILIIKIAANKTLKYLFTIAGSRSGGRWLYSASSRSVLPVSSDLKLCLFLSEWYSSETLSSLLAWAYFSYVSSDFYDGDSLSGCVSRSGSDSIVLLKLGGTMESRSPCASQSISSTADSDVENVRCDSGLRPSILNRMLFLINYKLNV